MILGQLAVDLARDAQTLQILNVKSVRKVQKSANRLEGPLLKRSRFLGWKPVWASIIVVVLFELHSNLKLILGGFGAWCFELFCIKGRFNFKR